MPVDNTPQFRYFHNINIRRPDMGIYPKVHTHCRSMARRYDKTKINLIAAINSEIILPGLSLGDNLLGKQS